MEPVGSLYDGQIRPQSLILYWNFKFWDVLCHSYHRNTVQAKGFFYLFGRTHLMLLFPLCFYITISVNSSIVDIKLTSYPINENDMVNFKSKVSQWNRKTNHRHKNPEKQLTIEVRHICQQWSLLTLTWSAVHSPPSQSVGQIKPASKPHRAHCSLWDQSTEPRGQDTPGSTRTYGAVVLQRVIEILSWFSSLVLINLCRDGM